MCVGGGGAMVGPRLDKQRHLEICLWIVYSFQASMFGATQGTSVATSLGVI